MRFSNVGLINDWGVSPVNSSIPAAVHQLLLNARELANNNGNSGARVRQFEDGQLGRVFLKIGVGEFARSVADEAEKVAWASQFEQLPIPRFLARGHDDDRTWFLMTAVPGASHECISIEPSEKARAAGRAVASLHTLPILECRFNQRLAIRLASVRERIGQGVVSKIGDTKASGVTDPAAAYERLLKLQPSDEDLVVSHCDLYLHNMLFSADGGAGVIDLGWLGVSDRHTDLALLRKSFFTAYGEDLIESLLDGYGDLGPINKRRLEFYELLDQFM